MYKFAKIGVPPVLLHFILEFSNLWGARMTMENH